MQPRLIGILYNHIVLPVKSDNKSQKDPSSGLHKNLWQSIDYRHSYVIFQTGNFALKRHCLLFISAPLHAHSVHWRTGIPEAGSLFIKHIPICIHHPSVILHLSPPVPAEGHTTAGSVGEAFKVPVLHAA